MQGESDVHPGSRTTLALSPELPRSLPNRMHSLHNAASVIMNDTPEPTGTPQELHFKEAKLNQRTIPGKIAFLR